MPVPTTTTARTGGGAPGNTSTGPLAPKGCHGRGRGEEGFVTETAAPMVLRRWEGKPQGLQGPVRKGGTVEETEWWEPCSVLA